MKKNWSRLKISLVVVGLMLFGGIIPTSASAAIGSCGYDTDNLPDCGSGTAFLTDDGVLIGQGADHLEYVYCGENCQRSKCGFCVTESNKEEIAKQGCDALLGSRATNDSTAYQNCLNCIKNSGGNPTTLDQCAKQYRGMSEKEVLQIEGSFTLAGGNLDNLRADQLQAFNPLRDSTNPELSGNNTSVSAIISAALKIIYPLVGVLLFALLVWGGIEILMAGTTANSSRAEQGKKRIFAAIIGAVLVFASMLVIKIIEALLGIDLGL